MSGVREWLPATSTGGALATAAHDASFRAKLQQSLGDADGMIVRAVAPAPGNACVLTLEGGAAVSADAIAIALAALLRADERCFAVAAVPNAQVGNTLQLLVTMHPNERARRASSASRGGSSANGRRSVALDAGVVRDATRVRARAWWLHVRNIALASMVAGACAASALAGTGAVFSAGV